MSTTTAYKLEREIWTRWAIFDAAGLVMIDDEGAMCIYESEATASMVLKYMIPSEGRVARVRLAELPPLPAPAERGAT